MTLANILFVLVITWYQAGERVRANRVRAEGLLGDFIEELSSRTPPVRQIPGVAVFMSPNLQGTPLALQAKVLRLRFGLDGEEPKTLKEIGERLDLTRERVRQIESEALNKLYESMNAD